MEDMSYDGDKFLGAYDSTDELIKAAEVYVNERHSSRSRLDLYVNEVELNGKPDEITKQSKLTTRYTIEEYT